jgi:hypothetical protein
VEELNLHVDPVGLLRRHLHEHVGLWSDLDGLGRVDEAQENVVVKDKPLSISVVNEPALNEGFRQEEFVTAHHTLLVLNHRDCLQLERERHVGKAGVVGEPPPDGILLLIKDGELVPTLGEDHVDADLVFANELGLNARVVVEAGKGIVDKLVGLGSAVRSLENRFELRRCRKVKA